MADTARNVTPLEAATELTKTWMEKHSAKPYPQVCEAFANFYHAAYRMAHGENANIEKSAKHFSDLAAQGKTGS